MNKIKKNANNIIRVEEWVKRYHPFMSEYGIVADELANGNWACKIELPVVNQTVYVESNREVMAMLNAAEKASELIDEYLSNNPKHLFNQYHNDCNWVIESDEKGNFLSLGMDEADRKELHRKQNEIETNVMQVVKKSLVEINNVGGSTDGLYIRVFSPFDFPEDTSIQDMLEKTHSIIEKETHLYSCTITYDEGLDRIIAVGYFVNE